MGYNLRITCVHGVLKLCSGSPPQETLISISSLSGPVRSGVVGQKMLCKVLIASTYNYIRNTCLHLVLILGCSSLFQWLEFVQFCQLPNCNLFTQHLLLLLGEVPLVKP